jgi:RecG-like helicase
MRTISIYIYPLIEESEVISAKSLQKNSENLNETDFKDKKFHFSWENKETRNETSGGF